MVGYNLVGVSRIPPAPAASARKQREFSSADCRFGRLVRSARYRESKTGKGGEASEDGKQAKNVQAEQETRYPPTSKAANLIKWVARGCYPTKIDN